jgi:transposase
VQIQYPPTSSRCLDRRFGEPGLTLDQISTELAKFSQAHAPVIAAQFVKHFVKSNKNDFVDAKAIAEAVERKNIRFAA